MASLASDFIGRVKETWGRAGPAQRWLAAGLGLALALAVGLGIYLNQPDWVVLVSQADPKDAAAVVARLQELKVPYRPTGDGYTILVPKQEQYTAKLALAQAGLPKGSSVGMELFDEPKFGATEFDRKVNYLRARQGDFERALLRINDLEYASVKLAIPEQSVFIREQQPVKASVLVQPRQGRKLSPEQVLGIVNFLAGSVQGLTPENVTVVDQTGRLLSSGLTEVGGGQGLDTEQVKRQDEMQRKVERGVQTLLEPMFGAGNVVARVNLELNMDASRVESVTIGGATPKNTTTEREATMGTAPTTQPARPNEPGAPPVYQGQLPGTTDDQWKTKTTTSYEVSNRKEVTVIAPGAVKRISVGIAINRADLTTEQIKQIREIVAGATGADASSISVAAMMFKQDLPSNLASQPTKPLEPRTLAIGLGAAAAVLLFGFLVTRRRKVEEPSPEPLLTDLPNFQPSGTMLDVALGMAGAAGDPAGPGTLPGVPAAQGGVPGAPGAALPGVPGGMGPLPGGVPAVAAAQGSQPNSDVVSVNPFSAPTPQQRLEFVMAAKPKRQVFLGGLPVDDEMMVLIDDLINNNPETCAELLRDWLKGGSSA